MKLIIDISETNTLACDACLAERFFYSYYAMPSSSLPSWLRVSWQQASWRACLPWGKELWPSSPQQGCTWQEASADAQSTCPWRQSRRPGCGWW